MQSKGQINYGVIIGTVLTIRWGGTFFVRRIGESLLNQPIDSFTTKER